MTNDFLAELLDIQNSINPIRRKVFISFHQKDKTAVENFIEDFDDVFIPKVLGVSDNDDFINSNDPKYVMTQIKKKYLGYSTVTIVMVGKCTHSRRYVDWEIKTSLRRGSYTPNGLVGISLKGLDNVYVPERLRYNWIGPEDEYYAKFYNYPKSKDKLRKWIEDAHKARKSRSHLIDSEYSTG